MVRVALKLAFAAAAVWAVWTYVPIGGRTLAERWRAAPDLSAFVVRGWAEATGSGPKAPARSQARQGPASPAPRPTEGHTEADRRAVDRILSDRL